MKYIIRTVKHQQQRAKQYDTANTWKGALSKVYKARATRKYSKIIIERSNVIKVFKEKT